MSLITALTNGLAGSTCRTRINTALKDISIITEIVAGLKTGADAKLVTGTAGATDSLVKWNADGDAVAAVADDIKGTESFVIALGDETTDHTTGTAKVTFRIPYAFTLTAVRLSLTTAATGGTLFTVDINEAGSTILSTKLTIDASETTSQTAATAAVISDSALADDAEITIDIDNIGSTNAGKGAKVYLIGNRT